MTSFSDLYIQLTRPSRKDLVEVEVITTAQKNRSALNQWRDEKWGALEVTITDDPNFKPTETFEIPEYNEPIDFSKPMSVKDAFSILEDKL